MNNFVSTFFCFFLTISTVYSQGNFIDKNEIKPELAAIENIEVLLDSKNVEANKIAMTNALQKSMFAENLVIGLAQVIVVKAQEEIISSFMEKFGDEIKDLESTKVTKLIPNIESIFQLIKFDIANYKNHLGTIQGAAMSDFKNIENTLPVFIDSTKLIKEGKDELKLALKASIKLINNESINEVICFLLNDDSDTCKTNLMIDTTFSSASVVDIYNSINSIFDYNYNRPENNKITLEDKRRYYSLFFQLVRKTKIYDSKTKIIDFMDCLTSGFFEIRSNRIQYGTSKILQGLYIYLEDKSKDSKNLEGFRDALKKLSFLANLSSVTSGDEMYSLIKNTALPAGSYKLKRTSGSHSMFLNSYLGLKGGYEHYTNNSAVENSGVFGMSAPVGPSWTYNEWLGVFIPLVDVGNYLTYTANDQVEDFPDFDVGNIFNPGIFIEFKPWDFPISFLAGGKYGPFQRSVSNENTKVRSFTAEINVSIDLPLYLIYN